MPDEWESSFKPYIPLPSTYSVLGTVLGGEGATVRIGWSHRLWPQGAREEMTCIKTCQKHMQNRMLGALAGTEYCFYLRSGFLLQKGCVSIWFEGICKLVLSAYCVISSIR